MIRQLQIRNIALISSVTIELEEGLNIITGETGSGKSIILDALNLMLGNRADRQLIRSGQEDALVQVLFEIEKDETVQKIAGKYDLDLSEGEILVSRRISADNKNTCRINGTIVPLGAIRELGKQLVDVHQQHQQHILLDESQHSRVLDLFLNEKEMKHKEIIEKELKALKEIESSIQQTLGNGAEGERKKDIYAYQLKEIADVNVKAGEDDKIKEQLIKLENAEKIKLGMNHIYSILYQSNDYQQASVFDLVNNARNVIQGFDYMDEALTQIESALDDFVYTIEDVVDSVRAYNDDFDFSEQDKHAFEERLDLIFNIKRKYGPTIEDVKKYEKTIEKELDRLLNSDEALAQLENQRMDVKTRLDNECAQLTDARRKRAAIFEKQIEKQLKSLGMTNAQFKVQMQQTNKYTLDGHDYIVFLFSANEGQPLKPLKKVASGGEMSRIMLALKNIIADNETIESMVFDEIDVGISGRIAQAVAEKMTDLAITHQVICITHAPQISAMSDAHFLVQKKTIENETHTLVKKLNDKEKVKEIARLYGGKVVSELNYQNANELIQKANVYKNKKASQGIK